MPRSRHDDAPPPAGELPRMARDSAQQIWLAGLGAFAKAQEEGGKVFKALVQEGVALQRNTQNATEAQWSEAAQRVGSLASGLGARAAGQWDRLEGIFEERVSKALQRLGVPTAGELQALRERVDALEQALARERAAAPRAAPRRRRNTAGDND